MQIRAAKTALYRGIYYRSRLEACWAAFFDAHGMAAEYEHRYFKFDDGTLYQPDFWLPESQAWFEVKGALSAEDTDKINNLARVAGQRGEVVLVGGAPAGHLFGEVNDLGQLNLNASFGRCSHCDTWTYAMFGCRWCGYAETDPTRSTYIDWHDACDARGCTSRCPRGGVWTWQVDQPQPTPYQGATMDRWVADSLDALSAFNVIPKKVR